MVANHPYRHFSNFKLQSMYLHMGRHSGYYKVDTDTRLVGFKRMKTRPRGRLDRLLAGLLSNDSAEGEDVAPYAVCLNDDLPTKGVPGWAQRLITGTLNQLFPEKGGFEC